MESTYSYQAYFGTAPNPPTGAYVTGDWAGITEYRFRSGTKIIMAFTHENRAVYRFTFDGVKYEDDIILWDAPQAEPFYYSALGFQVQNYVNGAYAIWQILGFW